MNDFLWFFVGLGNFIGVIFLAFESLKFRWAKKAGRFSKKSIDAAFTCADPRNKAVKTIFRLGRNFWTFRPYGPWCWLDDDWHWLKHQTLEASLQKNNRKLLFLPQPWKWRKGPSKTIVSFTIGPFLSISHFHHYGRKGNSFLPNQTTYNNIIHINWEKP